MSYQSQLDALNTKITLAEGAVEKTAAGRTIKYDLASMYKERARLERLAVREARGGLTVTLATVDTRS